MRKNRPKTRKENTGIWQSGLVQNGKMSVLVCPGQEIKRKQIFRTGNRLARTKAKKKGKGDMIMRERKGREMEFGYLEENKERDKAKKRRRFRFEKIKILSAEHETHQ